MNYSTSRFFIKWNLWLLTCLFSFNAFSAELIGIRLQTAKVSDPELRQVTADSDYVIRELAAQLAYREQVQQRVKSGSLLVPPDSRFIVEYRDGSVEMLVAVSPTWTRCCELAAGTLRRKFDARNMQDVGFSVEFVILGRWVLKTVITRQDGVEYISSSWEYVVDSVEFRYTFADKSAMER